MIEISQVTNFTKETSKSDTSQGNCVDLAQVNCEHKHNHHTSYMGLDPTNFWESNIGPTQNCVGKYISSIQLGPYYLLNPGGTLIVNSCV